MRAYTNERRLTARSLAYRRGTGSISSHVHAFALSGVDPGYSRYAGLSVLQITREALWASLLMHMSVTLRLLISACVPWRWEMVRTIPLPAACALLCLVTTDLHVIPLALQIRFCHQALLHYTILPPCSTVHRLHQVAKVKYRNHIFTFLGLQVPACQRDAANERGRAV